MKYASIANGIYVRTGGESLLEQYRRKQRECAHPKRDPRGTCYRCGHRLPETKGGRLIAAAFTATLCAHDGCFEIAVSRCECCNDQPFCEDHGSSGDGDTVPAHCWQCGGFDVDA